MEVTQIYLDLKEWPQYAKKGRTVWTLESEAFKEPLLLKLQYDDTDKRYIEASKKEVEGQVNEIKNQIKSLNAIQGKWEQLISNYAEQLKAKDKEIAKLQKKLADKTEREKSVNTAMKKYEKDIETLRSVTLSQGESLSIHSKEIFNKKPIYYEQTEFISWNGVYYYKPVRITWDHMVIQTTEIISSNEYVLDEDFTTYFRASFDGEYVPFYQLTPTTDLDTPTATVKITVLFFPM